MGPPVHVLSLASMRDRTEWSGLFIHTMEEVEEDYSRAAELIKKASILLIMSGAGMSAESGLRTYEEINQDSHSKLEYRDYCDPDLLRHNPIEFWKFWAASANEYKKAQPHKGYHILKELRDIKHNARSKDMQDYFATFFKEHDYTRYDREDLPSSFFVYSSNVDGLFAKSGIPPSEILEIHGNANVLQCTDGMECKGRDAESHRYWTADLPESVNTREDLPRCPCCKKICRPSVLMFCDEEWIGLEGEGTSDFDLYDVWEEAVEGYLKEHDDASIVIVEVGCGDRVPVVKMESETVLGDITNVLTEDGTKSVESVSDRVSLVRINMKKSEFLDYHKEWSHGKSFIDKKSVICLEGPCGEVLDRLYSMMWFVCWICERGRVGGKESGMEGQA